MIKAVTLIFLLSGSGFCESYKWIKPNQVVKRLSDGASIPNDVRNRDWVAFQIWLAVPNTPQAADPDPTPAEILDDLRAAAMAYLDSTQGPSKVERAIILVLIDELNILRTRDRDRSVDVAASVSLADLKTRWAARSALADRDMTQVKPAIQGKITAGTAD